MPFFCMPIYDFGRWGKKMNLYRDVFRVGNLNGIAIGIFQDIYRVAHAHEIPCSEWTGGQAGLYLFCPLRPAAR